MIGQQIERTESYADGIRSQLQGYQTTAEDALRESTEIESLLTTTREEMETQIASLEQENQGLVQTIEQENQAFNEKLQQEKQAFDEKLESDSKILTKNLNKEKDVVLVLQEANDELRNEYEKEIRTIRFELTEAQDTISSAIARMAALFVLDLLMSLRRC